MQISNPHVGQARSDFYYSPLLLVSAFIAQFFFVLAGHIYAIIERIDA
jgi:hypothetical protein